MKRTMIAALSAWVLAAAGSAQGSGPFQTSTFVYKDLPSCSIELDVVQSGSRFRADSGGAARPAVVHLHGGALINGGRETITGVVRTALERLVIERDYVLVSIDYRLAPETKLPEIITDLRDAFAWVRTEGPVRFRIDSDRIAAVGSSAGGYLALMSGFRLDERPQAIVSVSGYGAFGPWAIDPGRLELPPVTPQQAFACVGRVPVSNGADRPCHARDFYIFGRQQGMGFWPRSVTGWDPITNPAAYVWYSPELNVTNQFPPTLLVHGDLDLDVPHTSSVQMAAQLAQHGVDHVLDIVPGAGHNIHDVPAPVSQAVSAEIFDFLLLHL
ncbi:MAG: alpha/beta hydrolase [bacterium]|nr:alpha/beta hydrolase [bacterium]